MNPIVELKSLRITQICVLIENPCSFSFQSRISAFQTQFNLPNLISNFHIQIELFIIWKPPKKPSIIENAASLHFMSVISDFNLMSQECRKHLFSCLGTLGRHLRPSENGQQLPFGYLPLWQIAHISSKQRQIYDIFTSLWLDDRLTREFTYLYMSFWDSIFIKVCNFEGFYCQGCCYISHTFLLQSLASSSFLLLEISSFAVRLKITVYWVFVMRHEHNAMGKHSSAHVAIFCSWSFQLCTNSRSVGRNCLCYWYGFFLLRSILPSKWKFSQWRDTLWRTNHNNYALSATVQLALLFVRQTIFWTFLRCRTT